MVLIKFHIDWDGIDYPSHQATFMITVIIFFA